MNKNRVNTEIESEILKTTQQAYVWNPRPIEEFFLRLRNIQNKAVNQEGKPIKIELKNIVIYKRLSQESTAFTANIYINGINVGMADNLGRGRVTGYGHNSIKGKELLEQAKAWCKTLPVEKFPTPSGGKQLILTLGIFMENMILEHKRKKDLEKFNKDVAKSQEDSILFGYPNLYYKTLKFTKHLPGLLKSPSGIQAIKNAIDEKVLPLLKDGERILNTNLPESLLNTQIKKDTKTRIQKKIPPDRKLGQKR